MSAFSQTETALRAIRARVSGFMKAPPPVASTWGGPSSSRAITRRSPSRNAASPISAKISGMVRRVGRKSDRPLLHGRDPREALEALARERYPVYAQADITIDSIESPHTATVQAIIEALRDHLAARASAS